MSSQLKLYQLISNHTNSRHYTTIIIIIIASAEKKWDSLINLDPHRHTYGLMFPRYNKLTVDWRPFWISIDPSRDPWLLRVDFHSQEWWLCCCGCLIFASTFSDKTSSSSGFEVDFHTRIVGGVSIVFWNLWELGLGGLGGGVRVGEGQSKKSIRSILLYLRELQDVLDFRIIARKKTLMDLVPAPFSNKFFSNLLSLKRSIAITRISLMFSIMFCDCHCEFSKCLFVWLEPVVMCCDVLWCVVMCCDVLWCVVAQKLLHSLHQFASMCCALRYCFQEQQHLMTTTIATSHSLCSAYIWCSLTLLNLSFSMNYYLIVKPFHAD